MTSGRGHSSPDVVVVGSLNTDHVLSVDRLPVGGETVTAASYLVAAGGKGLNQAVAAARQGASVAFVGCVGDDESGRRLIGILEGEGVDVNHVRVAAGEASGVAVVTVAADGGNTVLVAPLANGRVTPADVERAGAVIDRAGVLLAQLEIPRGAVEAALRRARRAGVITVLNPAPAAGPLPAELLAQVDVLVPNETEAVALTGLPAERAAMALTEAGPTVVIVTRGSAGATAAGAQGLIDVPPFDVAAVDPTGAGDAFCGTLAGVLAAGEPLEAALLRSSAAGALATTVVGAVPSLPLASAVDVLLGGPSGT